MDLWPENLTTDRIKSPVTILKEQAALLGQKTQNVVQDVGQGESGQIARELRAHSILGPMVLVNELWGYPPKPGHLLFLSPGLGTGGVPA